MVNSGREISQPASVSYGVFQGSILGPLHFLIYVNDMSQPLKFHLVLYVESSCLVCQHININESEKQLNVDFQYMSLVCG